ncbi:MAG TPA: acyl-CoA dehydrogenase family protein [Myxococcales bacterium]|jgi:glutaryl-CoA dehydrogenase
MAAHDALQGTDLFQLDDLLTEEQLLVRRSVRAFVQDELMPVIQAHFRKGTFPASLIPRMGELGVLGANLTGYGCAGMDAIAYGLALQELERCDSGIRSFVSVQGALCMFPLHEFGTEEQKQRWLPKMATGELVGCFGLTEPDFGSDPGGMLTTAKKDGDAWVLNGSKMWITNGTQAHLAIVWAKTGPGQDSVRGFVVEKGTPGFEAREIEGKFSMRASDTAELSLQDVRVPESNRLPGAAGLKAPLKCLSQARYGIAWGATGAAIACFEAARDYALSRVQFGKPIAGFQLTQEKLAVMLTEIVKAQLVNLRLGQLKQAGKATHVQISFAKRNNVATALDIARSARSILGANGIVDEYPVIRHLVNLETVYTYEGTHEVHTLSLGRAITGLDAFV